MIAAFNMLLKFNVQTLLAVVGSMPQAIAAGSKSVGCDFRRSQA